jgi:hypothetical protein
MSKPRTLRTYGGRIVSGPLHASCRYIWQPNVVPEGCIQVGIYVHRMERLELVPAHDRSTHVRKGHMRLLRAYLRPLLSFDVILRVG